MSPSSTAYCLRMQTDRRIFLYSFFVATPVSFMARDKVFQFDIAKQTTQMSSHQHYHLRCFLSISHSHFHFPPPRPPHPVAIIVVASTQILLWLYDYCYLSLFRYMPPTLSRLMLTINHNAFLSTHIYTKTHTHEVAMGGSPKTRHTPRKSYII